MDNDGVIWMNRYFYFYFILNNKLKSLFNVQGETVPVSYRSLKERLLSELLACGLTSVLPKSKNRHINP
jgi:hypothetical protein